MNTAHDQSANHVVLVHKRKGVARIIQGGRGGRVTVCHSLGTYVDIHAVFC